MVDFPTTRLLCLASISSSSSITQCVTVTVGTQQLQEEEWPRVVAQVGASVVVIPVVVVVYSPEWQTCLL